jgi:D-galactose 1-dehydrogenase
MVHRIGLIGLGKITEDQHVPVLKKNRAFKIVATASQRGLTVDGVPQSFRDWREMIAKAKGLDAVAICTPPQVRYQVARAALDAGKHVLLEKPPANTLGELADLRKTAERGSRVLFQTWHSQYNAAVTQAKLMLAGATVRRLTVTWKEDVRHWHPGQQWIWQPGGYGVFDPGINALSIVTRIMPEPVLVRSARLAFPANRDTPIAASLAFTSKTPKDDWSAEFDWRQTGEQTWDIDIETETGLVLKLSRGGARLAAGGRLVIEEKPEEYEAIYRRFDELLTAGKSDVDEAPMRLVADAFLAGKREIVEDFLD